MSKQHAVLNQPHDGDQREQRAAAGIRTELLRSRLLKGVPIRALKLNVNGIATSVLEAGSGPPLVLLHGGIECGGVYSAAVISRLADRYRVVVPDVPGLGESAPAATLDAAAFAEWFSALLRLTCDEKPALVAHSLLGTLAARFAAQHGQLLSGLFIYSAPGVGPYRMPLSLLVTAIRFDLRPSQRNNERFERLAFLDLDRARRQDAEWFQAFSAYSLSRAIVPHVKRAMRQLIKIGTKQVPDTELRRIDVPTAMLWGRHDRFVPLRLAETASARLGWPLHVIDDAGHVPHLEQPDALLAALHSALASSHPERRRKP
jgi:pimeloyl-ACP methyl ester carboxylesterase